MDIMYLETFSWENKMKRIQLPTESSKHIYTTANTRGGLGGGWGYGPPPLGDLRRRKKIVHSYFIVNKKPDVTYYLNITK